MGMYIYGASHGTSGTTGTYFGKYKSVSSYLCLPSHCLSLCIGTTLLYNCMCVYVRKNVCISVLCLNCLREDVILSGNLIAGKRRCLRVDSCIRLSHRPLVRCIWISWTRYLVISEVVD